LAGGGEQSLNIVLAVFKEEVKFSEGRIAPVDTYERCGLRDRPFFMRTNRPYFVLHGNVCALLAAKEHVNVFLYDPLVSDPAGIITSGHENKTGRTVAITQGKAINEEALVAMFRAIIAHNRAGGWRKIMREH
jgi:hypothetical protein